MNKRKNTVIIKDDRVIKKNNDKLLELYDYLDSVGFNNYPKVINNNEEYIESEYIENRKYHELSNGIEFIKTVSLLHSKTVFNKDVSKNKYRTIYNKISNNLEYLKKYYENLINNIENEEYMKPSHYLLIRNYTILDSALKYSKNTLKKWFKKVENKSKERVCIVHNNLSLDHFIKGDKNYLISFDNYLVDTPVLDIFKFYKKDGYKLDFNLLLNEYNKNFELLEEEKMLLNILISMPPKIEEINDEYLNTINIKNTFNYIYSSMSVVNENK